MASDTRAGSFHGQVFPAELSELRRRRRVAGDPRPLKESSAPDVDLGLVGLSCSGGGIRSASFSLGVVQCLLKRGVFRFVDYVSTVSGGGYLGSCVSALMQSGVGGERLLVDPTPADEEPPALNHLRNGSNYLMPGGLFNALRIPALFVIGLLQVLLLMTPPIVFLVFLTELADGFRTLNVELFWLPSVGVLPLVLAVALRPVFETLGRGHGWASRDRRDRRLGYYFLLALSSLLALPTMAMVQFLIDNDFSDQGRKVAQWVVDDLEAGVGSRLLWSGGIAVVLFVLAFAKLRARLLVLVLGVLGPGVLVAEYFAF